MTSESADTFIAMVGARIAELRRQRGMTQDQFAERLGVSVQYVRKVERGENLTLRTLHQLAALLMTSPQTLMHAPADMKRRRGRPPRAT